MTICFKYGCSRIWRHEEMWLGLMLSNFWFLPLLEAYWITVLECREKKSQHEERCGLGGQEMLWSWYLAGQPGRAWAMAGKHGGRAGHGSGEGGSDGQGKGCWGQARGISLQTPRCHVASSTELGGPSWRPPELVGGAVPPGRGNLGISGFSGAFPGWPAGQRAPWWHRGGGSAPLPLAPSARRARAL